VVAGCGGRVVGEEAADEGGSVSHDPGPVHVGAGRYELTVTATQDDCEPPLFVGGAGEQVVIVVTDGQSYGFNVPLCDTSPPVGGFACARSDFSSDRSFDATVPVAAQCGATQTLHGEVLAFDGDDIVIEYRIVFAGLAACPVETTLLAADCTSQRTFRYHWLASCPGDANGTDLERCGS
jgi:hypothetical protein